MILYYDRQGRPMSTEEWNRRFTDRDYQVVAQHWIRGWKVSTIWLGLDHNFTRNGPPVIFETMVFPPGDDDDVRGERYMDRYSTEEAAHAGHDRAIAWVRDKIGDDAAMDILSAAQFSDPAVAPDDASGLA